MARRRQEEEATEELEAEAAPAGAEFVPEAQLKPRSDVYTLVLILTFLAFLTGSIVAGREAWEHYDVQFWMFTKEGKKDQQAAPASATPEAAPVSAPEAAPPAAAPPAAAPAPN
jgi:hypothetical protein